MTGVILAAAWILLCAVLGFFADGWWITACVSAVCLLSAGIINLLKGNDIHAEIEDISFPKNEKFSVKLTFFGRGTKIKGDLICENALTHETSKAELKLFPSKKGTVLYTETFSGSCGQLKLRLENLRRYDILGITYKKIKVDVSGLCVCTPAKISEDISVGSSEEEAQTSGLFAINGASSARDEMSGVREYAVGDSCKDLHWKLSCRLGDLYVKEYSAESGTGICMFFESSFRENALNFGSLAEKFYAAGEYLLKNDVKFFGAVKNNLSGKDYFEPLENEDDLRIFMMRVLSCFTKKADETFSGFSEEFSKYNIKKVLYFTVDCPAPQEDGIEIFTVNVGDSR